MTKPVVAPGNVVVQVAVSGLSWESVPVHPAPSPENETEPVGTPAPGAETPTVALRVTLWPTTGEGGLAETDDVEVTSGPMVSVSGPAEPRSLASPP